MICDDMYIYNIYILPSPPAKEVSDRLRVDHGMGQGRHRCPAVPRATETTSDDATM